VALKRKVELVKEVVGHRVASAVRLGKTKCSLDSSALPPAAHARGLVFHPFPVASST